MEYSEKYGMDVDEAVRLALEELGLREDQVMVTVLEEPSKGFLGIGGSKFAKVRVERIEDTGGAMEDLSQAEALAAEKPQTKANHDFRKKNKGQQQGQGQQGQQRSAQGASDTSQPQGRQEGGSGRDARQSGGRGSERSGHGGERSGRSGRERDRGGRGGEHGGGRGVERGERGERSNMDDIDIDVSNVQRVSEPIENLVPDPENEAAKFLADVVSKMGLDVQIEGFYNEECNYIEVKGQDTRVVIGKRGQTLDALQYLTNLVSNKGAEGYKRVIIDVEGYRSRREKTLEQLAVKLAKKVISTGRSAKLEPMNPYERKVIHATLQHVEGIITKSEGDEPYRRVIIERK